MRMVTQVSVVTHGFIVIVLERGKHFLVSINANCNFGVYWVR